LTLDLRDVVGMADGPADGGLNQPAEHSSAEPEREHGKTEFKKQHAHRPV
jgi:hypothetical protein